MKARHAAARLAALAVLALAPTAARALAAPIQLAQACDPTFGGKYHTQLRRLHVPGDARTYGRCKDWGRWSGNSYRGHRNLPRGYWTYSWPYWYIWAGRGRPGPGNIPGDIPRTQQGCRDPSMGGKYSGLLRRLSVPQDRQKYGACRDYGTWSGRSYRGHTKLPRGYWVYSAPYWYIWARRGMHINLPRKGDSAPPLPKTLYEGD